MGKIIALDMGEKRIGLAITDDSQQFAFPRDLIKRDQTHRWFEELQEIIEEEGSIEKIIVGIPLDLEGRAGKTALKIRQDIQFMKKRTEISIEEWDERDTSQQAEYDLKGALVSKKKIKTKLDSAAASLILQRYLESLN